jgi:hypothetical protein
LKKILFLSFFSIWALSLACQAMLYPVTKITEGSQGINACDKNSGQPLWQSNITSRKMKYQGKDMLYLEENGKGICGKDKTFKTWQKQVYSYISQNQLVPYQVKIIFKDTKGNVVRTLEKYYDQGSKKVTCKDNGKIFTFDFTADLLDEDNLDTYLSNFPISSANQCEFHLLTHEPAIYKMTINYLGIDSTNNCYKFQMIPDLGMANIFGVFVPKTYFWYSTDPSRTFVRYEGLESGLGTPYLIMTPQ